MADAVAELGDVEVVGLLEETELPGVLSRENGTGTASEASVVDSGHARLVVGELFADFGFGYGAS